MGNTMGKMVVDGAMSSMGLNDSSSGGDGNHGSDGVVDGITDAAEGIYNGVTSGTQQGMTEYKLAKSRNMAEDLKQKYQRDVPVSRQVAPGKAKETRAKAKQAADDIRAKYQHSDGST